MTGSLSLSHMRLVTRGWLVELVLWQQQQKHNSQHNHQLGLQSTETSCLLHHN